MRVIVCALLGLAFLALAGTAGAGSSREVVAVLVGANVGGADEEPLRFAASDAGRVRDLLTEIGDVGAGAVLEASGDGPDAVLAALRKARQQASQLASPGRKVTFIFYYSGHGDDDALHLAKGNLALRDLRAAIADVPADLRLTILDACRTSGRAKGVSRGPAFDLEVAPDSPRGNVELRASAVGEAAQESDALGGAVFTHFIVSGLRGAADADSDGRVTLGELYAYAYKETLVRTASAAVLQHPSVLMNLAGAGEVILTSPGGAKAFLEVPRGPERYIVFARPSDTAMGELSGEGSGRLALPAGKFLVVRRAPGETSVASVDLSWGGTKRLAQGDFRRIAREELARRGGHIELRPMRLEARLGGELSPGASDALAVRVGGAFVYSASVLELELEAAYVGGPFSSSAFDGGVRSVAGGPNLGVRILSDRLTLVGFAGAEVRYSWEHLARVDAARANAAGFPSAGSKQFASAGPRVGARATLALGGDWSASFTGSFTALLRREAEGDGDPQTALHPVVGATFAVGYAF
jgi:hypothetical protein